MKITNYYLISTNTVYRRCIDIEHGDTTYHIFLEEEIDDETNELLCTTTTDITFDVEENTQKELLADDPLWEELNNYIDKHADELDKFNQLS